VTHDAEAADGSVRTVALVGLGVIGQVHLRTLAEVPELGVGCVVDPRAEAREGARRAGLPAYDDVDALLRDVDRGRLPAPDLYVVATPTSTHVGLAERLLATTAADVLTEKPLADDPAALEVLAARPDVHDRLRVVNHFAFSPEVEWAARLAHERGWGPPTSVLSVFNDPYVLKPEHERATYVSSWTDSGPNQLVAHRVVCRDPAHPLLSLGSARETACLLREAHELASPTSEQAWESWSGSPRPRPAR
jgi:predicted dehydrogenase